MAVPRTSKEDADSIAFFGMWSPIVLFPVVLIGTNEARCAYCLCLLVAILSTDAMSPPAAAALPFLLFSDMGVEQHALYFKIAMELLHQTALVLLVVSLNGTSLMCRVALYTMALFGTRVRALLCGCVVGGVILTLLTNGTIAVLLMAAVIDNMVQLLQNELVQMELLHQTALVLLVVSLNGTSLMCRVALYTMALFGTRVRALLCGCVVGGVILTLLTNGTIAVLLMAAVIDNMVQLLQNELVQALQQRALFDKATIGMSSLRRRLLEDMLWPRRFGDREAAASSPSSGSVSQSPSREQIREPPTVAHPEEVPVRLIERWSLAQQSQRQGADREALPKLANSKYANSWVLDFLTDTQVTDEQLINRETSILDDGQLVVPGQASPEHKGVKGIDREHAFLIVFYAKPV
ncbi:hypothetical protein HPB50_007592 [Hyalomma asiaticum]|uniref:Uncharacterized protein n=1 Tax=Hyalomma asiaticum TaxID=266040 RepID=A0ACB7TGI9_HYAAI|nr:hypothetical protein HPB50_007592 [Hyalomma asiaticum]